MLFLIYVASFRNNNISISTNLDHRKSTLILGTDFSLKIIVYWRLCAYWEKQSVSQKSAQGPLLDFTPIFFCPKFYMGLSS